MLKISSLPSRRHAGARAGHSARAPYRQSVVASGKKLLVQDFSSFKDAKEEASLNDVKNLWNKPAGAGAKSVKDIRGVSQGRLDLSSRGMHVNIKKGALLFVMYCTIKESTELLLPCTRC
jgi:hypothetical protein